jgi:hypothetical protein
VHGATSHPERIAAWWDAYPLANIGCHVGASDLVVVDEDGPEAADTLARFGPFPPTWTVLTRRGRHTYWRTPLGPLGNTTGAHGLGPGVDTRGVGGYVVLPPSIHPSGFAYAWAPGLSPWDLEPAPLPDALAGALFAIEAAREAKRAAPVGTGTLTFTDAPALRRLRAYVAALPTGLADGGGRKRTAYLIAKAARKAGLSHADALELVTQWNRGNTDPLPAREVVRACADAGVRREAA